MAAKPGDRGSILFFGGTSFRNHRVASQARCSPVKMQAGEKHEQ